MGYILPEQRTSASEKQNPDWYKETYDYYTDLGMSLKDTDSVLKCYKAANGIIDKETFEYVLHPLGNKLDDVDAELPGELRNTDFITPIKERNIGEYIELPYKFFVKCDNPNAILQRDVTLREELEKLMQQQFINVLNSNNVDTGVDSKPVPDIKEFASTFLQKWFDDRANEGQKRVNLINDINDFDTRRIQLFYDWWTTEEFYTYHYIQNNEPLTDDISPLEAFPISNGEQFVEDYDGFIIVRKISWNQFLDKYSSKLKGKDIDYVKALSDSFSSTGKLSAKAVFLKNRFTDAFKTNNDSEEITFSDSVNDITEAIILFKSEEPFKVLSYLNPLGEIVTTEVPNDYELDIESGDIEITTKYRQFNYTGVRIGDMDKGFYFPPVKDDVQRYDPVKGTSKLPVGGKQGLLQNVPRNPIPLRLVPYLAMDRILYLQLERTIAKYKGYIQLIPKSLMNNDDAGTTGEKYFYMYADNTLMYDDTLVDMNVVDRGFKVVGNDGLANYIKVLIELRRDNKQEAWEVANMNNERYGAAANSQTVGNAQQNVYRAKLGSTLMITMFNAAMQREHMADIEFSKYAWHTGKSGTYFDAGTNKSVFVEIDPRDHNETRYGLFIRNSKVDEATMQAYSELAFNASQNGDVEIASEVLASDNVPELRQIIHKLSEQTRAFEEAQKAKDREAIKYSTDKQVEIAQNADALKRELNTKDNQTKENVAWIQALGFNDESKAGNSYSDVDIVGLMKQDVENFKLRLAERTQVHKEEMDKKKLAQKKPTK